MLLLLLTVNIVNTVNAVPPLLYSSIIIVAGKIIPVRHSFQKSVVLTKIMFPATYRIQYQVYRMQYRTPNKKQERWSRLDFLFLLEHGCVLL